MIVTERPCKSLLTPSGIAGCDFAANPYVGCAHACVYCYAKFMKRFTGHTEPWGRFLDARVNAVEVASRQLRSGKFRGKTVMLSSVTDPYQPAEKGCRFLRSLLPLLAEHDVAVSILTKSSLVLRDIDLLAEMKNLEVGITITGLNEAARKYFDPGASPYEERLIALLQLAERRIVTYAFVGPILPGVTDLDFNALLSRLRRTGVGSILFYALNYSQTNLPGLLRAARAVCPDSANDYRHQPERVAHHLTARIRAFEQASGISCTILHEE